MEASKKGKDKKAKGQQEEENQPQAHHTSQGHNTQGHEESQRAATTDSSREPKNPNDDLPTGGNVR
jgi:hypothetical protein